MGSVWAFLEEGHLLRHFWLAKGSGSVFLFQCLKMSCLGSHLGIVLWANWNLKRHQGQLERENTSWTAQELSASKAIWIQTFYSAHCRAKAFRLELTFFFLRRDLCYIILSLERVLSSHLCLQSWRTWLLCGIAMGKGEPWLVSPNSNPPARPAVGQPACCSF